MAQSPNKINEFFIEERSVKWEHLKHEVEDYIKSIMGGDTAKKERFVLSAPQATQKAIILAHNIKTTSPVYLIYNNLLYTEMINFIVDTNAGNRNIISWDATTFEIDDNSLSLNLVEGSIVELLYFI